ncbi:MAG: ROK family protein [Bacteroidales bacterium]
MDKEVAIGLDIGGTNSVFGIVDKSGNILYSGKVPTSEFETAQGYVDYLSEQFHSALNKLNLSETLKGIGIGAPNGNFFKGTIENAANLQWKGIVPLVELLHKHFGVPVSLTNDANAAALGELLFGGAQGLQNFIVLTLGTGLGSGIVVNGDLVYGHDAYAGELGHTFVYLNSGRICGCGRRGCLETYVSAQGLRRTALELLSEYNIQSELRDVAVKDITSERVYNAAVNKDEIALKAFDITGKYLGMKLSDFVATISPSHVFLYGGLAKSGDLILKPAKKYMEENIFGQYKNKVKLLLSELNETNGALLGSAALVWKKRKKGKTSLLD